MTRDPSLRVSHAMDLDCVIMLRVGTMRAEWLWRKFDSLRRRPSRG